MLKTLSPWFTNLWEAEAQNEPQAVKLAPEKKSDDLQHWTSGDAISTESSSDGSSHGSPPTSPKSGFHLSQAIRRPTACRRPPSGAPVARAKTQSVTYLLNRAIEASIADKPDAHELWDGVLDCVQRAEHDLGSLLSRPFPGGGGKTVLEALLSSKDLRSLRLVYESLPNGSYCDGKVLFDMHGLRTWRNGPVRGPGTIIENEFFFKLIWTDRVASGQAYSLSDMNFNKDICSITYFPKERRMFEI